MRQMTRQQATDRPALDYLRHASDLSRTDRAVIEILQADGRRSFTQIAHEVGISERTARRRVQQLVETGVIKITAVTDPVVLGYGASALVGLDLDGTRPADDVAADFASHPAVDYVVVAAGRHALYVEILCRDQTELLAVIDRDIRAAKGVSRVDVFPYLSIYYQLAQFSGAREKGDEPRGVRPAPLDSVDRRIVRELSKDGRAPFLQIAQTLGISESQVRQRMKRLTSAGIVQVIAIINPLGLEYRTMAWLAVRAAPDRAVLELAETFARLRFVTYVAICAGRFDLFVEVICISPEELLLLLDNEVRTLPGIGTLEVALYQRLHYKPLLPIVDGPPSG
jgi:Lrp/AsnC family transcriptional regulator for asnA, asnC and gidA